MLRALIVKELLALRRDLHGLAAIFVLPVVFIVVMSLALRDVYNPRTDKVSWALLDQDNTDVSQQLSQDWAASQGAPAALADNWREQLMTGQLTYVLTIDAGSSDALRQVEYKGAARLHLVFEPAADAGLMALVHGKFQEQVARSKMSLLLERLPAGLYSSAAVDDFGMEDANDKQAAPDISSLTGRDLISSQWISQGMRPNAVQHNVPAWLIFGMFFVVTSIAGLLVEERNCGALARMYSLGVNPGTILLGKVVPFFFINMIQALLMLWVGVQLMPLLGGDPLSLMGVYWPALVTMMASISMAAICLALLVASLVRSHTQASAVGPSVNILMAALGGIMVPTFVMPESMQWFADFSPMNWALDGLLAVLVRHSKLIAVLPEAISLLLFALACLAIAWVRLRIARQSF